MKKFFTVLGMALMALFIMLFLQSQAVVSNSGGGSSPPAGGDCIADSFHYDMTTDPTGDFTVKVGSVNYDATDDEIDLTGNPTVWTLNDSLCSNDIWLAWQWGSVVTYSGGYFRTDNNMSNNAYALRNNADTNWPWRRCIGGGCNDLQVLTAGPPGDGDYGGLEVEFTGDATIVRVWHWGSTPPPARGSWGTADMTYTTNPGAYDAVGYFVGLYNGDSSADSFKMFAGGPL